MSGETFGNGYEKMLDVKLFKTIAVINWNLFGWTFVSTYTHKLFEAETYTTPLANDVVAHKLKFGNFPLDFKGAANSVRGILDNVPGGSIDATDLLHKSITGIPALAINSPWANIIDIGTNAITNLYFYSFGGFPRWETHVYKPNQCFIPTFSGIGMKNPNQNWANPLNRNLVCSNETYFDSYYGEAHNTKHGSKVNVDVLFLQTTP